MFWAFTQVAGDYGAVSFSMLIKLYNIRYALLKVIKQYYVTVSLIS